MQSPVGPPSYTVAVRALCEFTARQGDLELRLAPSPSAREGIEGHKTVAARRSAGYRPEVPLSGAFRHLVVRGRADGYDPERKLLEEVKTFKGDLDRLPVNQRQLHWAQARVYGWLLCQQLELPWLDVSLVYFDIGDKREVALVERHTAAELQQFFELLCGRFLDWADRELAHRERRDRALDLLRFPHPAFRTGQRALAESVFRAARLGRCLMAQAPTGIGKSIGTLFPLLKACAGERIDKVFFLSAKGSGRALALQAIDALRRADPALPLRVVELVARDKACEHPDKICDGASCPLASGFYDRLPGAREAAVAAASLTRDAVRRIALAHRVCPYWLGQELAQWCDVVVGDYNHYFDGSALLYALTLANPWRVAVLVDEAHNLVDRARAMYSAELVRSHASRLLKAAPPALQKPLARLDRAFGALARNRTAVYQVLSQPPPAFTTALQKFTAAVTEHLAERPGAIDGELLRFHFDALQFHRLLESFGAHSLFDVSTSGEGRRKDCAVCIRNVVPASFLRPRFDAARSTVLFSATLAPQSFYADTLGLPQDAAWVDIEAPFAAEQLSVRIERRISTRFRHRADSLEPIAALMAAQYLERPGNYLAFFSSFDYLQRVAGVFAARHPGIPVWLQSRGMREAERESFLARFALGSRGVGFAVLGGSFAEGIDLPGERLIGAFIATLGLPEFTPVNEQMRGRIDAAFGAGYEYTYLFPGIRKVVQAAGRVIRTPSDRGSVHLIDDRFARPEVRPLLPRWWRIEGIGHGFPPARE